MRQSCPFQMAICSVQWSDMKYCWCSFVYLPHMRCFDWIPLRNKNSVLGCIYLVIFICIKLNYNSFTERLGQETKSCGNKCFTKEKILHYTLHSQCCCPKNLKIGSPSLTFTVELLQTSSANLNKNCSLFTMMLPVSLSPTCCYRSTVQEDKLKSDGKHFY